jgi:hypothetical protein
MPIYSTDDIDNNSLSYYIKTTLRNAVNTQAKLIQQLMARINQLEADQGSRVAQAGMLVQPVEPRRPRLKLPNPEPYDGTKRLLYKACDLLGGDSTQDSKPAILILAMYL